MRRPRRTAALLLLALGLASTHCGDDGPAEGNDDGVEGTTGDAGPPHPSFTEPASGRVSLPSNRVTDLTLGVQGILPGATELVIDGQSLGPLDEGAAAGRLDARELQLYLRGSLAAGRHSMLLRTADPSGIDESEIVEVTIAADTEIVPVVEGLEPISLTAHHLHTQPQGEGGLLLVHEDAPAGPLLHLFSWHGPDFDVTDVRTVALPGLVATDGPQALPVSALRYFRPGDANERVRVAWRVGATGDRIDLIDARWDTLSVEAPPKLSLTADEARADRPAEWAQLGRPWLLPDLLLAELWAPLDAESPRPGDRMLAYARVHDQATGMDPVQHLAVGSDRVDLDLLGPAIDGVAALTNPTPPLSVRVDRVHPLVIEHDPDAGVLRARGSVVPGHAHGLGFASLPLATVVGAFGSRTVLATSAESGGRLRVSFVDDLGDGGVVNGSFTSDELLDLGTISGEIAAGSIDGLTVFLVPFGREEAVRAVYARGSTAEVAVLDELRCDAVAFGGGSALERLPVACAHDGALQIGHLVVDAP